MRKCHHIFDKEVGRVHIPGCMASAVYGEGFCTCYPKNEKDLSKDNKDKIIRTLEKENAALRRIIEKIYKNTFKITCLIN